MFVRRWTRTCPPTRRTSGTRRRRTCAMLGRPRSERRSTRCTRMSRRGSLPYTASRVAATSESRNGLVRIGWAVLAGLCWAGPPMSVPHPSRPRQALEEQVQALKADLVAEVRSFGFLITDQAIEERLDKDVEPVLHARRDAADLLLSRRGIAEDCEGWSGRSRPGGSAMQWWGGLVTVLPGFG